MRFVSLLCFACLSSLASAQEVGECVLVVVPSVELRDAETDGQVVETLKRRAYLKVLAVSDDQLGVLRKQKTCWIDRSAVIPEADAIHFYTAEIERNPSAYAYEQRATLIAETDRKQGLEDVEQALRLDPNYARAWHLRGIIRSTKGEFWPAMMDFDRALKLDPTFAQAYADRAKIHFFVEENRERSLSDIDEAIRLNPESAYALSARGDMRYFSGDIDGAYADYDEAIRINASSGGLNKMADILTARGVILERKGRFAEAAADYSEATRQQPDYLSGHRRMAWLMATCPEERFRDGTKALEHALEAQRLSKAECPLIMETLAAAYAETDQFDEAIEWMEKALQTPQVGLVAVRRTKEERQSMLVTFQDHRPWRQVSEQVALGHQ